MNGHPKSPKGLQGAGKKVWDEVLGGLSEGAYLPPSELHILHAAAAQADTNAALEEKLEEEGLTVRGAAGQWRLNGAAGELRQGRLALAKLLAHVGVDVRVTEDDFDRLLRGELPSSNEEE